MPDGTLPTYTIDGTIHSCTWDDGVAIEVRSPHRHAYGIGAEVRAFMGPDHMTNQSHINLLDDGQRQRFAASCLGMDGKIAWAPRLLLAVHSISQYLEETPQTHWEAPQTLPATLPPVPQLPEDLLPTALRPWLTDIAERVQIPLEYVAIPAIVGLSTVVGRRIGARGGC